MRKQHQFVYWEYPKVTRFSMEEGESMSSAAASVVTYTVDPESSEELRDRVQNYLVPAAREIAGYRGFLLLDQGENRRMAILLFDSVEGVQTAQRVLSPVGEQHTYALMTSPAIGSLGRVVVSDGVFGV